MLVSICEKRFGSPKIAVVETSNIRVLFQRRHVKPLRRRIEPAGRAIVGANGAGVVRWRRSLTWR
jgi:hypothetical protein